MIKKLKKRQKINFLLENKHFQRLHLILYFLSVLVIVLVYFITLLLFGKFFNIIITSIFSLIVGVWLVLNRDIIVKKISDKLYEKKIKKSKKESEENLKRTIKRLKPNSNINLKIKEKSPLMKKVKKVILNSKKSLNSKKNKEEYIEIKD
jgi:hypothetical protein